MGTHTSASNNEGWLLFIGSNIKIKLRGPRWDPEFQLVEGTSQVGSF